MPRKIVVDTNVFVAALLSSTGANRAVLRACLTGQVIPLMGSALFHEYEDVLSRNDVMKGCPLTSLERRTLLDAFLSVSKWVKIYYLWRPNLRDEGDNHVLELALAGQAHSVVTNNARDFRSGELSFPKLRILTPAAFLKSLP